MGIFKLWDKKFLPYFSREEWGAQEEKIYKDYECTELALSHVRFCYDDLYTKYETTETVEALRRCQRDHMDNLGLEDIKYNFAINPDGIIFECRGWYTVPAAPSKYDRIRYKFIDICFIGDYSEKDPPWSIMRTALHIVMKGLKSFYINSNYRLIGLRDPPEGELQFI